MKVWHYAPWAHLPAIVESGKLKCGNAGAAGELPMLWFSANQQWEPTATKMLTNKAGAMFSLTFKQQAEFFGCIRFGLAVADPRLLKWKDACTAAGTPREVRRKLEKMGKKIGGDPAHWFASAAIIPLSELHFQVWHEGWHDAPSPQDKAEEWTKAHANRVCASASRFAVSSITS